MAVEHPRLIVLKISPVTSRAGVLTHWGAWIKLGGGFHKAEGATLAELFHKLEQIAKVWGDDE